MTRGSVERHQTGGIRRRLPQAHARRRIGAAGDLAVGLLGERPDLVLGDVAGDDDDGVVGRVVAIVEGERIGAVERRHLARPADGRNAVVAVVVERRIHRHAEAGAGAVVDAHAALLQDHLALGQERGIGDLEVGHAVGLELPSSA